MTTSDPGVDRPDQLGTTTSNAGDFDLYDVLARNAQAFGHKTALIDDQGTETSYATLLERVDHFGSQLAQRGLGHGDRVGALALNSIALLELFLACARQGIVIVPINWRLQKEEVQVYADRSNLSAFAFDAACAQNKPELEIEHWIDLDAWPGVDDELPSGSLTPRPSVQPDDPWAIIATAAVNVVPRGALLSHRNVLCSNVQEIAALGLSPNDGNLVALPLFHIAGLGHCIAHLHVGATNVMAARFDAAQAVELIDRHSVTHISDFPPVLTQILDRAQESGSELASLRLVTGLDSPETMQRLHEQTSATFWTGFGQTETTGFVTLQNAREQLGCAGRAAELCRVELVDDYDRPVEVGQTGEIVVRGPLVFLGYDAEPEVTEHTFRGGWHHTGDVGRFDDDGRLYYVKRKAEKELIKPGGENVYPAEVEAALVSIEGVENACVFGVSDPKWGEAIRAVVEVVDGFSMSAAEVRDLVGERIARFKRPRDIIFVDRLTRDEAEEIDREAVKTEHG